ncbi:MAG: hydroxymethylglutaryl-CoA synthase family protein [Candidatus Lokiarchaeota archaeon]|nr:hydroxymethylglutaryl-CoA synthase family protein [Candidatus Lokiarchaeota archaeon]
MMGNEYLFTNIGIDSIAFYAPRHYMDIGDLAEKRNVDPDKYKKGLLLKEMRLPEVDEDIISIGLKAGYYALLRGNINPKEIDAVFVGTETVTYAVKSVSNIFAELLGISKNSITQDIYNACAGGTLALLNAVALIEKDVISKALVINADISSYQIGSPSEATQGSGAIALIISKNPRVASFSKKFGKVSGNVNDFFRPANEQDAQVFGHYSVDTYLSFQLSAYDDLINQIGDFYADFYAFHAPFSKLALKSVQQIIEKRWVTNLNKLLSKTNNEDFTTSIFTKFDKMLQDISVVPEYLYLKLKEKGLASDSLEHFSNWVVSNVKGRVLPHLRVPMHFGNMYNASVWAQVCYILENHARDNDTIYFGSYGSGATCISGLLKVKPSFKDVIDLGPKVNDFIKNKTRASVQDYEMWKAGTKQPDFVLGRITEHEENAHRGFILHFCDEGCIIPNVKGLNYCPKGHSGFHTRFFPLYAVLESDDLVHTDRLDTRFLKDGLVRVAHTTQKESILEYEMRRVFPKDETNASYTAVGMLNWIPMYIPVDHIF